MFDENVRRLEDVAQALRTRRWWAYDSFGITYGDWRLTINRKPNVYKPYLFAVEGSKKGRTLVAPRAKMSKRYRSIESALLHIFNEFNDDPTVENQFRSLDEAISRVCKQGIEALELEEEKAVMKRSATAESSKDEGPTWWRMRKTS